MPRGERESSPGVGGGGAPVLTKVGSHPWSSPGARNIFLSKVLGERASNEWDFIAKSCLGGVGLVLLLPEAVTSRTHARARPPPLGIGPAESAVWFILGGKGESGRKGVGFLLRKQRPGSPAPLLRVEANPPVPSFIIADR